MVAFYRLNTAESEYEFITLDPLTQKQLRALMLKLSARSLRTAKYEKLHHSDLFTVRLDAKKRLFLMPTGDSWIFLHIMDDHNYTAGIKKTNAIRKTLSLQQTQASSSSESVSTPELVEFLLSSEMEPETPSKTTPDITFETAHCLDDEIIVLNREQHQVIDTPSGPCVSITCGPAGSGKTSSAYLLLEKRWEDLHPAEGQVAEVFDTSPRIYYLAPSQLLVNRMINLWRTRHPNPTSSSEPIFMTTGTWAQFTFFSSTEPYTEVKQPAFISFMREKYDAYHAAALAPSTKKNVNHDKKTNTPPASELGLIELLDAYTTFNVEFTMKLYQELCLFAAYGRYHSEKEDRKKSGAVAVFAVASPSSPGLTAKASYFKDSSSVQLKEHMPRLLGEYRHYLAHHHRYDVAISPLSARDDESKPSSVTEIRPVIILDEGQNVPLNLLNAIRQQADECRIFMDDNQSNLSSTPQLPHLERLFSVDAYHLSLMYRCPSPVARLAHHVLSIKKTRTHGKPLEAFVGDETDQRPSHVKILSPLKKNRHALPQLKCETAEEETSETSNTSPLLDLGFDVKLTLQEREDTVVIIKTIDAFEQIAPYFPGCLVLTEDQVQGLEFSTVIIYEPLNQEGFNRLKPSAAADAFYDVKPFNQLYVNITRSSQNVYIMKSLEHSTQWIYNELTQACCPVVTEARGGAAACSASSDPPAATPSPPHTTKKSRASSCAVAASAAPRPTVPPPRNPQAFLETCKNRYNMMICGKNFSDKQDKSSIMRMVMSQTQQIVELYPELSAEWQEFIALETTKNISPEELFQTGLASESQSDGAGEQYAMLFYRAAAARNHDMAKQKVQAKHEAIENIKKLEDMTTELAQSFNAVVRADNRKAQRATKSPQRRAASSVSASNAPLAVNTADAQYQVGHLEFFAGKKGGAQADKKLKDAVHHFRSAAAQGHAGAHHMLGICYETGTGTDKNLPNAFSHYKIAAEQGHVDAQYMLGCCYHRSNGTDKDLTQAIRYYQLTADQGHALARYTLGVCYENGQGITADLTQAIHYYQLAAHQGNPGAKKALQRLTASSVSASDASSSTVAVSALVGHGMFSEPTASSGGTTLAQVTSPPAAEPTSVSTPNLTTAFV